MAAVTNRKQIVFPFAGPPRRGRGVPEPNYPLTMDALLWAEARSGSGGRGAGPNQGAVSLALPVGGALADLASSCRPHRPLSWHAKTQRPFLRLGSAL